MSSKHAMYASRIADRQLLRAQWLRSGICARCFHNGRHLKADGKVEGAGSSTDKYISPRRVRGAAISNELEALAQKSPNRTRRSSGSNEHKPTASSRSGNHGISLEDAMKGRTAPPTSQKDGVPLTDAAQVTAKQSNVRRRKVRVGLNKEELLRLGQGTSTIAGSGYRGVLVDLFHKVRPAQGGQSQSLVQQGRPSTNGSKTQLSGPASTDADETSKTIATPSTDLRQAIFEKLVLGKHEGDEVLDGKEKYKQSTLNIVARGMVMNSTYLGNDAARFLKKVRSLIPAGVAPKKSSVNA